MSRNVRKRIFSHVRLTNTDSSCASARPDESSSSARRPRSVCTFDCAGNYAHLDHCCLHMRQKRVCKVLYLDERLALWVNFSADILIFFSFLIFPGKQDLTIHANYLHKRHFAWNVKSCFLKIIIIIINYCQYADCWISQESGWD